MTFKPKLRPLQANMIQHEGKPYLLLGDPLRLSEETVAVPQPLIPFLQLCDGTRDLAALRIGFELRTGIRLSAEIVEQLVAQLDRALLLESETFRQAREALLHKFQSAPARPPALAGRSYPSDPGELGHLLEQYLNGIERAPSSAPPMRGVISPHIDYQRGGRVYAQVWSRAARSVAETELAIIFGTNHIGGNLFTLTRQNYATPWGTLPTAVDIVDRMDEALGRGIAFEEELCHCNEHSIELALVWLHYFLGKHRCQIVPILCGSFDPFVLDEAAHPAKAEQVSAVVHCLREATASRRTLVIAAADLAHMGPTFGDSSPLNPLQRAHITAQDRELMAAICAADADRFFTLIKQEQDKRRICGMAPIYMTLRVLGQAQGEVFDYMHCPADPENGSVVSICGLGLY